MKAVNVAITGAAGHIGYALAFRVAAGAALGPATRINLRLLEITPALGALQGIVMELNDCAFPTLGDIVATDDARVAFRDCEVAFLVGARPRGPGMERKDLLIANAQIFSAQGKALSHVTDIRRMTIWGNHSSTQYPDLSHAEVAGRPAKSLVDPGWISGTFIPVVQQRGAAVIKARGASSAASAASAAIDHVHTWVHGTPAGDWVSMAVPADGSYGIEAGVVFSYPVTVSNGDYRIVPGLALEEFSRQRLEATYAELREERDGVKSLLS